MLMSNVTIVSEEDFITVVSDGLVTNLHEINRNPQKNYQKFKRFGENNFIAYVGHLEMMELISDSLVKNYKGQRFDSVMNQVKSLILTSDLKEGVDANIAIGGFNENREAEIYVYSTKDDSLVKKSGYGRDTQIIHFYGPETDNKKSSEKMKELVSENNPKSPTEWVKVQKKLNSFVAQMDSTVNDVTFSLILEKSRISY